MPDISKITLPSGTTYDIKDATARAQIEALAGSDTIIFMGVSTVELTDGGNEIPIVNGEPVTPATGHLFFYGTQEFIYGADNKWHALGSLDSLGDLAYKNSASGVYTPVGTVSTPTFTGTSSTIAVTATDNNSGNYQPKGTISQPTFSGNSLTSTVVFTPTGNVTVSIDTTENKTVIVSKANSGTATYTPEGSVTAPTISVESAGTTGTIHNPTKQTVAKTVVAAAPGATAPSNNITYYAVTNETLSLYQLGYTTGDSITTNDITVKTGDATYTASQPTFTGTGARLITDNIAVPKTYTANFTGIEDNVNVTGTPSGTVTQPTFTGTKVQLTGEITPEGTISQPRFTGTQATIVVE